MRTYETSVSVSVWTGAGELDARLLEQLLFDDITFLNQVRMEHDKFADVLRSKDVEVLYLEGLAAEALKSDRVKQEFLQEYLDEAIITDIDIRKEITDYSRLLRIIAGFIALEWQHFLTKII